MEIEVTDAKVMMAFQFFLRATNDCTRRCDVLKLDDEINGDDRDCLSIYTIYIIRKMCTLSCWSNKCTQ